MNLFPPGSVNELSGLANDASRVEIKLYTQRIPGKQIQAVVTKSRSEYNNQEGDDERQWRVPVKQKSVASYGFSFLIANLGFSSGNSLDTSQTT